VSDSDCCSSAVNKRGFRDKVARITRAAYYGDAEARCFARWIGNGNFIAMNSAGPSGKRERGSARNEASASESDLARRAALSLTDSRNLDGPPEFKILASRITGSMLDVGPAVRRGAAP